MNKTLAVLKREYLQAVRKKMFVIVTISIPILFGGMMFVPMMIARGGLGEKQVAIIDGTGALEGVAKTDRALDPDANFTFDYVDAAGRDDLQAAAKPWLDRLDRSRKDRIDGVLVIPADAITGSEVTATYYSRSSTDLRARTVLGRGMNREVQKRRLLDRGIAGDEMMKLLERVDLDTIQITRSGEEKKGGELDFIVGFVFAGLLLLPSILYGVEVMRGVVQEKSDRVVEILVSSMKPSELLTGKILGLAAVGLTQLTVWVGMAAIFGVYAGGAAFMASDVNISQFLRAEAFVYFFIFFILAYMLYVCVYAIAGAISNNEKEAQQFVGPVMLVLMIPWFVMMPIILNPDSTLSVFLSLFPLFAPITMFVRILVSDPPLWQIATAIALSVGTIWGLFWLTAKIFRVGILSYGKRPTIPELWRWLKVA